MSFKSVQQALGQSYGTEKEDSDGNVYDPINDGPLPPDNGTVKQAASWMCVFEDMAITSQYYGINPTMDQYEFANWYAENYNKNFNTVINSSGIDPEDFGSVLGSWFDTWNISDEAELDDDLSQGNMVMGIWDSGNGSGAHDVLIIATYGDGTCEYFDPADGTYSSTSLSDFNHLIEVTPREP